MQGFFVCYIRNQVKDVIKKIIWQHLNCAMKSDLILKLLTKSVTSVCFMLHLLSSDFCESMCLIAVMIIIGGG